MRLGAGDWDDAEDGDEEYEGSASYTAADEQWASEVRRRQRAPRATGVPLASDGRV